jgi:rhamnogalacturonyl hydrolase YesR
LFDQVLKRRIFHIFIVVGSILFLSNCRNTREVTFEELRSQESLAIDTILDLYLEKYRRFIDHYEDSTMFPRSYEKDKVNFVSSDDWTSGFFPGILWYLYEYSGDEEMLKSARKWTSSLREQCYNTSTHDIGFIINSSFGQGYRLTRDESYKKVLDIAAQSLASRFNDNIHCIKSLDTFRGYDFPVLIDNMVNLEILFKAWHWNNNQRFYTIANEHALRTMEMHFKSDFSSFQIVDYNTKNFQPTFKGTFQGYADSSSWSRGQAWGLYGFILAFRETRDRVYLDQSIRICDYILSHNNFPDDCIPYWDFQAPGIPAAQRDAAAAAVLASALIELSMYEEIENPQQYLAIAENIITSLAGLGYIASIEECENFVLKHSIGNMPGDHEVDVPLIYGDYYFLEALMKYKNHVQNEL